MARFGSPVAVAGSAQGGYLGTKLSKQGGGSLGSLAGGHLQPQAHYLPSVVSAAPSGGPVLITSRADAHHEALGGGGGSFVSRLKRSPAMILGGMKVRLTCSSLW